MLLMEDGGRRDEEREEREREREREREENLTALGFRPY